ncbi:MAG: IS200/IS605 family element transposase accessory protein TnpB [Methanomassiliicoccus sp.]|nr:IS200/IS605 family element transposase accessory protein TnpB [Methanomassiliicoccus sp.]
MAIRKYEYRLYPDKKQIRRLEEQIRIGTEVYNRLLTIYKEEYLEKGIKIRKYDLEYHVTSLRKENVAYGAMYRITLTSIAKRISRGLDYYFRQMSEWKEGKARKPGLPRYKKSLRSIEFAPLSVKIIDDKTVKIGRIGKIEAVVHRETEGEIKEVTVIRKPSGKWHIIFTCDIPDEIVERTAGGEIGIDMGVLSFATLSDGTKIENPRFLAKSEKRIRRLHKDLSRKVKGSNNWMRTKDLIASAYETVENQRNDFLHKTSRALVDEYRLIAVESLGISRMIVGQRTAKSISDVSWYKFRRMLEYKASSAGTQVIFDKPFSPTSKTCSACGNIIEMPLSERTFVCPSCGLTIDRDINAAINILNNCRAGSARIDACGDGSSTSLIREKRVLSLNQELYV